MRRIYNFYKTFLRIQKNYLKKIIIIGLMQSYKDWFIINIFWKDNKKMDKIIKISTELYLLNYLYREKVISEQEYYEIKKYI